jgi:DNA ligase-1
MQPMIKPMLWETLPHYGAAVEGWLASEKLDGFRAIWDGTRLYSRQGRVFPAPEWFTSGLPDAVLDGELWHSRGGGLRAVQSAVKTGSFHGLTFRPFDAPRHFGPFVIRLGYVNAACVGSSAVPVPHVAIRDYSAAREFARKVFHDGGEGAVLRRPDGLYHAGKRSAGVLKCKPGEGLAA